MSEWCISCGSPSLAETRISRTSKIKYGGRMYEVVVPDLLVLKCGTCGEIFFDNRADEQKFRALREMLGLLQPEMTRRNDETT